VGGAGQVLLRGLRQIRGGATYYFSFPEVINYRYYHRFVEE
jgi:hypothetical protein